MRQQIGGRPTLGKRFLLVYGGGPPDFFELGEATKPFGQAEQPAGGAE